MYLDFNNISVISIAVHFIEGEKTLYSTYRKTLTLFEPLTNFYHLKIDSTSTWMGLVWFMVFNATSNDISVVSWRSVLLLKEIRVPVENHRPVASH